MTVGIENMVIWRTEFRTVRNAKRFAKIYALLLVYNSTIDSNQEAYDLVSSHYQKEWAYKELRKMRIPQSVFSLGSFDDVLAWYLNNII